MSDRTTKHDALFASRIGPNPAEVRRIHELRQANLPAAERASDPSAPAARIERAELRDAIARSRSGARTEHED